MTHKQINALISKRFEEFKGTSKNDTELKGNVVKSFIDEYAFDKEGMKILNLLIDELHVNVFFNISIEDIEDNTINNKA